MQVGGRGQYVTNSLPRWGNNFPEICYFFQRHPLFNVYHWSVSELITFFKQKNQLDKSCLIEQLLSLLIHFSWEYFKYYKYFIENLLITDVYCLRPVKMSTDVYNLKWKHFNVDQDYSL